ncbi:MAG: hypothetical protein KKB74_06450, partial [Bacteroidetes bacterium]|nr:hypothetical protein [Bacteroidota bacterium]
MRIVIIVIFFLFCSTHAFNQEKNFYLTKILLVNNADTIQLNVMAYSNLWKPKKVDERYFSEGVTYIKNDERKTIPSSKIKYLEFVDLESNKRCFINSGIIRQSVDLEQIPQNGYSYMMEEKIKGKVSWYRTYKTNLYDGGSMAEETFIKDGELVTVGLYNSLKHKLTLLMSDDKEIVELIKKT